MGIMIMARGGHDTLVAISARRAQESERDSRAKVQKRAKRARVQARERKIPNACFARKSPNGRLARKLPKALVARKRPCPLRGLNSRRDRDRYDGGGGRIDKAGGRYGM